MVQMKRQTLARNTHARHRYAAAYGAPALRSLWHKPGCVVEPLQSGNGKEGI